MIGQHLPHEFESFARQQTPSDHRPQITIQPRGRLSLNRAAFEALGSPGAVELLFDTTRRILGLRAIDANDEHAFRLRAAGQTRRRYLVAAGAFTKHHKIPTDVSRRWNAELEDHVLLIDLTTEGTEVTSNRRGTGSGNEKQGL